MFKSFFIAAVAFMHFAAAPAQAQQEGVQQGMQDTTTLDTENQRLQGTTLQDDNEARQRDSTFMALATKDEGSWVGIRGIVKTIGDRSFILAYEGGTVAVAFGSDALRQHQFIQDQSVTVYGRVDKNFFDQKVIKARAVVVDGPQPTEHLVIGEEDAIRVLTASHVPGIVVHGRVTNISGRNITLDQADGMVTVDTSILSYDPTKSEGHKRVEVGDLVTAQGLIRSDLWTGRTLKATSLDIIKFSQLDQSTGGQGQEQGQPQEDGMDQSPEE